MTRRRPAVQARSQGNRNPTDLAHAIHEHCSEQALGRRPRQHRRRTDVPASTRPTLGRVREALFSILGPRLDDARVLDLYAGTGALGLTALSRGASEVHLIERSREALTRLDRVTARHADRATVHPGDCLKLLPGLLTAGPFDLIFADPPYSADPIQACLGPIATLEALSPEGRLVLETEARTQVPETFAHLRRYDHRTYGGCALHFFTRSQQEEP